MDRHAGKIYGLGLRFCGSPQQAEELVQETFLLAFRKWGSFEGRSDPATWLYTIATRVCRRWHRLRSGQPRRLEPLGHLLPTGEPGVPDIPSADDGPYEDRLRREAAEVVERAMGSLPAALRLPLVLKELGELSVEDVSAILGLKVATVKTRLHRARLALRRDLARALPQREAPPPDHARSVCLDFLAAKQEALDRGVPFQLASGELCARCRALFATLDLAQDACRAIGRGELPAALRAAVLSRLGRPQA